jgi:alpha-tubulin suppressor-like RCC1 family protein
MSGFYSNGENFDRIFITEHQLLENFIGTRAFSWGAAAQGALGDGTTVSKSSPVDLSGKGNNWRQLSMGGAGGAGVKLDGTLWTWGAGTYGVLGSGSTASRSSPQTTTLAGTDWKEVSIAKGAWGVSSGAFCAAIKLDGVLYTWGNNSKGQLGSGTTTNRSSPVSITAINSWNHIACGVDHTIAVTSSGELYSWGSGAAGALGSGSTASRSSPATVAGGGNDWIKVSAGSGMSAAIKSDGTLWTWGSTGSFGALGDGLNIDRSSPGTTAVGGTTWERVSCGGSATSAIKIDGTLWTWGLGSSGQLGTGSTASRSSPGTVAGGGTNWKDVAASGSHMAAVKADGSIWTWGANGTGQLGTGNTTSRSSPGTIQGGVGEWQKVAASDAATGSTTLGTSLFIG